MPEVPSFSWTAYNANAANSFTRPRRSAYNRFTVLCFIISRNSTSIEYADGTISGPLPTGNPLIRFAEHQQDIPHTFEWDSVALRGFNEIRYYIREVYKNLFVYTSHDVVGDDGNIVPPASLSTVYEKKNTTLKEGKPLHHHVCSRCKKVSVCQFTTLCSNHKKVKVPCNDCAVKFAGNIKLKVKKAASTVWSWRDATNNLVSENSINGISIHGTAVYARSNLDPTPVAVTVAQDAVEVGLPDMHLGNTRIVSNTLRYNNVDTATAVNLYDEFVEVHDDNWATLGEIHDVIRYSTAVTQDNQSNTEAHEARNQAVPTERPSGDGNTGDDWATVFSRFYGDTVA